MAEEETTPTPAARRMRYVYYAVPAIVLLGVVVWILSNMGAQTSGATLGRILGAMISVLVVAGLVMLVLRRREKQD